MTVYANPPDLNEAFVAQYGHDLFNPAFVAADIAISLTMPQRDHLQTHDLTVVERTAIGLGILEKEMKTLTWNTGNGVVLCGPPASGKTSLESTLRADLRYMRHTPTDKLMHKEYDVQTPPHVTFQDPIEEYLHFVRGYIYSRVRGLQLMQHDLAQKNTQHKLNEDEIVIGGILQSFVALCAYTKTYEINQKSGAMELPEPLIHVILLMMKQWAPRFFVYVDAPYEERLERARKQDESIPNSWAKRRLPFLHETELRELTITTLRKIQAYARKSGHSLHLVYFPTGNDKFSNIEGFTSICSVQNLIYFIERRQEHPTGLSIPEQVQLAQMEDTLFD